MAGGTPRQVNCIICGKEFTSKRGDAKYCGEICRRKFKYAEEKARRKARADLNAIKKPKESIAEVQKRARAAGLSYGQYMAKVEAE